MAQRRVVVRAQEPIAQLIDRTLRVTVSPGAGRVGAPTTSTQNFGRTRLRTFEDVEAERVYAQPSTSTSTHLPVPRGGISSTPNQPSHVQVSIGLASFLSSSCRHRLHPHSYSYFPNLPSHNLLQQHRLYATTKSKPRPRKTSPSSSFPTAYTNPGPVPLSLITPSEQDEVFFDLVSSPSPPITDTERRRAGIGRGAETAALSSSSYYHHHRHPSSHYGSQTHQQSSRTSRLPLKMQPYQPKRKVKLSPPDASREALWDWRLWFSSKRGGLCRGLGGLKAHRQPVSLPVATDETAIAVKGKGKVKMGNGQLTVRRKKNDVEQLKEGEKYYEEVKAYKEQFLPSIAAEQYEDAAILRERLATWSLERLKEEGYTLTDLSAFWMQKDLFGKPTAAFSLGPGVPLPEHRFENGTSVLLTIKDPLSEEPILGSVARSTASQIHVCFAEKFPLEGIQWRLDVGRPTLVFDRMKAAVEAMSVDLEELLAKEGKERETAKLSEREGWREYILNGTALRDVLLRGFKDRNAKELEVVEGENTDDPLGMFSGTDEALDEETVGPEAMTGEEAVNDSGIFSEDQRIESWVKRYSISPPLVMDGDMSVEALNASQIKAMALMVGKRVSLVQGPPGTGKTKTILHTLTLLKRHFGVPQPILVCTYTNVAVDNLVEGLAAAGLRPLRVGFGPSIRPSLLEHSLTRKLELHPLNVEVVELVKQENELYERIQALFTRMKDLVKKLDVKGPHIYTLSDVWQDDQMHLLLSRVRVERGERYQARLERMRSDLLVWNRKRGGYKGKIYALQQQMLRDIVGESDVICTTCITAASSSLNVVDFPIIFLDEASMSTEPASLIPIMKGCKHLALIGDHKQLPPVILSQEAKLKGLGVSLFERLTKEGNTPSVMLDTQYRMHPEISSFPSKEFYLGGVRDGTVDAEGNVRPGLLPPRSLYLKALRSAGAEAADPSEGPKSPGPSVIFLDHAGEETTKDRSRVNHTEAAIIAKVVVDLLLSNPELRGSDIGIIAPYVAQISLLTRMLNTDATYKAQFKEALGDTRYMQLGQIEVKTVDGFEGREKEVIVFSTVRNNGVGQIGFLADRRRLNVGLTRAKRALFVVGSIATLRAGVGEEEGASVRAGGGAASWRRYAQYLVDGGLVAFFALDSAQMADLDVAYLSSNPPNPKPVFRQGDWICARTHCAAHNFGRNLSCIGCGCPRSPTMNDPNAQVFYSSAQPQWSGPQQPQQHQQRPVDIAQLTTQLASLTLPKPRQQHQPPPLPKPTQPLLTPSGRAFAIGGRVQNISSDPLAPCIMYWPDNEPFPEQGQIRPSNVVGVAPPILNTGNRGPISHQPGDWICQKCNYLNWRRRKVCQTCLPYAEGNGDSISAAVQAERIALLTQVLAQTSASSMLGQPAPPSTMPGMAMTTSMTSTATVTPGPRPQTLTPPQVRSRVPHLLGGYQGDATPSTHAQGHGVGRTIHRSRSQLSVGAGGVGYTSPSPMIYQTGNSGATTGPQARAARASALALEQLQQQQQILQQRQRLQQQLLHQSFPTPPPHHQHLPQQPQQQHRVQQQQVHQQQASGAGVRAPPSPLYATGPVPGAFSFAPGPSSRSGLSANASTSNSPTPSGSSLSTPAPGSAGVSATPQQFGQQQQPQNRQHSHEGGNTISVHAPAPLLPSFLQDIVQSPPSLSPASNASSSSVSELEELNQEDLQQQLDDGDYTTAFERVRMRPRVSSGSTDSSGSGRSGEISNIWRINGEEKTGSFTPFGQAGVLGAGHGNGGVGVIGMGRMR